MEIESSKNKIESLRAIINDLIVSENCDYEYLVQKSQELDVLIVQALKEMNFVKKVFDNENINNFDIITDKLRRFEKIYDSIRIVDPVKKEVLELKEDGLYGIGTCCYKFWDEAESCENCVSARACNINDTITKVEYSSNDDNIYFLTGIPINIYNRRLSIELIKDASNSLYLQNGNEEDKNKMIYSVEYMNQIAVRDKITKLYNKGYIDERLPVDLLKACLNEKPISIIFVELDNFNNIEDIYGDAFADKILKEFASELKKVISSKKDWAARCADNEFMIVLNDTDDNLASSIADEIKKRISEKEFIIENEKINLTLSVSCVPGITQSMSK
jgi:two-component system, cell cycle response regulator